MCACFIEQYFVPLWIIHPYTNMLLDEVSEKIIPILIKHKVKKAGIFGSVATHESHVDSDLDLLVEFDVKISLFDFIRVKQELEIELNKQVDLVEYQAIKPRLRDRILSEEIRIYG